MGTIVRLPKNAVSEFDLPRVCVATGATEGVSYHKVNFTFIPMWARLSVAFCGVIGIVLMVLNTKKVQAEMPFTEQAFAKYKRDRIMPVILILAGLPLIFVPIMISEDLALVGFVLFLAMLVAAIVYAQVVTKQAGPFCKEIDEHTLTLEVPSEAAAVALNARVGAPATF